MLLIFHWYNASNKRRPEKGVRWRPKAGTHLIALLYAYTAATKKERCRGCQHTGSKEKETRD
jgi:hypothetical protein